MTLVGDDLPRVRQKETLCRDPHLSTPVAVPLRRPGTLALTAPERRISDARDALPGLRFQETRVLLFCVPGSPRPVPEHSFPMYASHVLFASPEVGDMGVRVPPRVPKTESFPKLPWSRNKMPKSQKNLLPVLHCAVCVGFPHPYTNPSRKGGEKKWGKTGSRAAPQAGCGCAGPAAPPAQLCAAPRREVGSAGPGLLARPRNYWFLPRLVPFIDSAVRSAGVTTGQTLFSPSFPPPPSRPLFM